MNFIKKYNQSIVLLMIFALLIVGTPQSIFGGRSATTEFEYDVSNYTQYTGSIATTTQVMSGGGGLISVVITEDFAGDLVFLDATSTTAYAIANGTRIADMQSALTEGVYTFDVPVENYLYMVSADGFSFAGDITVIYE